MGSMWTNVGITAQKRPFMYASAWLYESKQKNFFAQPKNLPQIYMAKIGMQKSRFKFRGGRFLAKISRKLYANRA